MGETLVRFQSPVKGPDGTFYEARACGRPMDDDGRWEGWIEFAPVDGGDAVPSRRETTQPNRVDTAYWASGLTPIFLEGALARALQSPPAVVRMTAAQPSIFPGPAPSSGRSDGAGHDSILNPFSVYQKGESLLRSQLAAMSSWHLVRIVLDYNLSPVSADVLNEMPQTDLIEMIVEGVRLAS
jgi:hypothetical protein